MLYRDTFLLAPVPARKRHERHRVWRRRDEQEPPNTNNTRSDDDDACTPPCKKGLP